MLSLEKQCYVDKIYNIQNNNGDILEKHPRRVTRKQNAEVRIVVEKRICLETYETNKKFGRFLLRDNGKTIGMGIVEEILE